MQKRIFAQNFKQAREELKSLLKVFVFRLLILVAVSIGALIVLGSVLLLATWYDGYVDNNTLPEGAKEVKIRTLDGKYRDFVYTVEHGDWFSEEGVDARIWLEEGPKLEPVNIRQE
jgi:hypothetical protein